MSLINQMLHDLEKRSTVEIKTSPLNGLSAIDSITPPIEGAVNYRALTSLVMVIFASGVMVAYLLDSQQQKVTAENILITMLEKELPVLVENTVSENTKMVIASTILPSVENLAIGTVIKPDVVIMVDKKVIKTKEITPLKVSPDAKNIIEEIPVNIEQNINKIIHPLTDKQQSQLAFQRAIQMIGQNNQQDAQRALEEALSFSSVNIRARETLAALLLNTGRISEAVNNLHEGLQLIPDAAPLAKLYARILVDQGDPVTAVAVLERARPTVASDPGYHALLAALYRQVKKHALAARIYQQILLQQPGMASWWLGLALAQDAMGETALALDAFQRAQRVGGLGNEVLKYMQTRVVALMPVPVDTSHDLDDFFEE